jgi:hypothetical protein
MTPIRFLRSKRKPRTLHKHRQYNWTSVDSSWGRVYTLGHRKPDDGQEWDLRFVPRKWSAYVGWDTDRQRFWIGSTHYPCKRNSRVLYRVSWRANVYGS